MPGDVGVGQASFVQVGTTATLLVGPSESRRAIRFFSHATARYTLGSNSGVTLDNGPTVPGGTTGILLTADDAGGFVKGQIWAVASAAAPVGFIECLYG